MARASLLRRVRSCAPACALLGGGLATGPTWRPKDVQTAKIIDVDSRRTLWTTSVCHCHAESAPMRTPYPELEPYQTGYLTTADGKHQLYYEVSGNPDGKPALFLHGGPGDGAGPKSRRLFDPSAYRIVVFDQRGAGKSTPAGSLEENTTGKLVDDIEQLREFLGIEKWGLLVGGSWGSTLTLAYSTQNPCRVSALVLYSIFTGSKEAIQWTYSRDGAGQFFPEEYEAFVKALPVEERSDLIAAYAKRLSSKDPAVCHPARTSHTLWIMRLLGLQPDEDFIAACAAKPEEAGPGSAIELHYMKNNCFLDSDQLLEDCWRIAHIPCAILHGRSDVLCTPANAWALRKRLPQASVSMVPLAGHSSSMAPQLKAAVIEAIDSFR